MYSLRLKCLPDQVDVFSGELWEAGTIGVRELDQAEKVFLTAFFENRDRQSELLQRFAAYEPEWRYEEPRDWAAESRKAWFARPIGERLFLAPPWSDDPTPRGRIRIIHNPGLACGTGEHPCTQLALLALEECVFPNCRAVDIGTGSGILAIAAASLGAAMAAGIDIDAAALETARENSLLNGVSPLLLAGSANSLTDACSDVTVANISGTVLLSILYDLRRITRGSGVLILTGFPETESSVFAQQFPGASITGIAEWRCITARLSAGA